MEDLRLCPHVSCLWLCYLSLLLCNLPALNRSLIWLLHQVYWRRAAFLLVGAVRAINYQGAWTH